MFEKEKCLEDKNSRSKFVIFLRKIYNKIYKKKLLTKKRKSFGSPTSRCGGAQCGSGPVRHRSRVRIWAHARRSRRSLGISKGTAPPPPGWSVERERERECVDCREIMQMEK